MQQLWNVQLSIMDAYTHPQLVSVLMFYKLFMEVVSMSELMPSTVEGSKTGNNKDKAKLAMHLQVVSSSWQKLFA